MKNKKKSIKYETVWSCDFCGKEFRTKKESNKHETFCTKNASNRFSRIFIYCLFKLGFWPIIAIGILYCIYSNYLNNIYTYENWVYACPDSYTSKCYKIKADINQGECEDIEIDIRGNSGGHCTDSYVEKIYFDNNGYISFDYCNMEKKDKWICYPENSKDGVWNIELSETKKVKK